MAVLDFWNNPLGVATATAIGYRGDIEEFPHDLYSYILSTIRESDQNDIALIYRWLQPMQQMWEAQYSRILALFNLLSPEDCPVQYLDYLRKNIGILDDLSYIWGYMTENDKRKFIKYFSRFVKFRGTSYGILEILKTMTGYPVAIHDYFHFRWLISGDSSYDMETALGREDEGYDPWLISEESVPVHYNPDDITWNLNPSTSNYYYTFDVSSLVDAVEDPPIPDKVIIRCLLTGETYIGDLIIIGSTKLVNSPESYAFGQGLTSPSTLESDFIVGFEADQYVTDLLVVDDGTINHNMVQGLVRFSRPSSERIWIRYHKLIEIFEEGDRWSEESGTVVIDNDSETALIGNISSLTRYQLDYLESATWNNYSISVKSQNQTVDKYFEIRFMLQDSDNYYYLRVTPSNPPTWPPGQWRLGYVESSSDNLLDSGDLEYFDIDVNYTWRIDCFTSSRPGGDVQIIQIYQDENLLSDYVNDPLPWTSVYGTIELVSQNAGYVLVDNIFVMPLPMESEYVGPTI